MSAAELDAPRSFGGALRWWPAAAIAAPLACAWAAEARWPGALAVAVQEDGVVEWASFWAFVAAAAGFAARAAAAGSGGRWRWFPAGLALFCLAVALEEISWGQRLLGYRPPEYFLEHNFQQELNLHNLVDSSLRKLALKGVLGGYGVLLPLAGMAGALRRRLDRWGVQAPTPLVVPGFFAALVVYQVYPWKSTGEVVELAMALGFLVAGLAPSAGPPAESTAPSAVRDRSRLLAPALLAIAALAWASAIGSAHGRRARPENLAAVRLELAALGRDVLGVIAAEGERAAGCGLHRRLYTWARGKGRHRLEGGEFSSLTGRGLAAARADFLLDPWESPYWIRKICDEARTRLTIYSFGANRRREAHGWKSGGDDLEIEVERRP